MQVMLNNAPILIQSTEKSLQTLLSEHFFNADNAKVNEQVPCAVAVNNTVIPKTNWCNTFLNEGDDVAVFEAIAGG